MRLFYKLLLAMLVASVSVAAYDLLQGRAGERGGSPRIRFDAAAGRFTFRKPDVSVRIVYASMFSPGEPVMRVRDEWIYRFEEEYSDLLAGRRGLKFPPPGKGPFVREALAKVAKALANARRRLARIDELERAEKLARARLQAGAADAAGLTEVDRISQNVAQQVKELAGWLADNEIFLVSLGPRVTTAQTLAALRKLVAGLEALSADADPAAKVDVAYRLVTVDRRWQGRWVLSANRPRFLSGREVPDLLGGSKMEVLALVQDGYAVPLSEPLPGETVSPLDGPDTWGDPKRRWRDAFIPAMLEEGKYDFLPDPAVHGKIYLPPTTCSTFIIFYNEILFAKAGIEQVPRTWPEFIAVCDKLKAAGIVPLTADAEVYSDMWQTWLTYRAVGPEVWEATVTGVPVSAPPAERKSNPPWTDPGYKQVYAAIRHLRAGGYFDKDFIGSTWPAAQRGYAKGSAAMMICGSWLVQELGGYKDKASAESFKLNCFTFPRWPGGREQDQTAAWASPYGMIVCRQGGAVPHAIELVKYLSARDHPDMVYKNAQISCMVDADFSPALSGIEKDFKSASAVYSRSPEIYARRFAAQTIGPLYRRFFRVAEGESGFLSVEKFLQELSEDNDEYLRNGGEEGYE